MQTQGEFLNVAKIQLSNFEFDKGLTGCYYNREPYEIRLHYIFMVCGCCASKLDWFDLKFKLLLLICFYAFLEMPHRGIHLGFEGEIVCDVKQVAMRFAFT